MFLSLLTSLELQGNNIIQDVTSTTSFTWDYNEKSKTIYVSGITDYFFARYRTPWYEAGLEDKIFTVIYNGRFIGPCAFQLYTKLSSVIIYGDAEVSHHAFYGCNISFVRCDSYNPGPLGEKAFDMNASDIELWIPYGTKNKYEKQGWNEKVFTGGIFEYGKPAEENEPVPESRSQALSEWESEQKNYWAYMLGLQLDIDISDIALEEKDSLNLGDHLIINRLGYYDSRRPEWSSSNPSVVSISKDGMIFDFIILILN